MPDIDTPSTTGAIDPTQKRLIEVAGLFLRLGFTAFGGPAAHIAMMRNEVVQRRKWVSDERFLDLMSIINLVPGPNSTQLAIYLGYLRAGWPGLLLAGICFISPAMLIVLALAWLYVHYGALPQVDGFLYGIKPVVVAIIAQALWGLCRSVLKGFWPILLALIALLLYILGINSLLLLVGSGFVLVFVRWLQRYRKVRAENLIKVFVPFPLFDLRGLASMLPASAFLQMISVTLVTNPVPLLAIFFAFLKLGAIVYGSGYVLLAFLRTDLVQGLHWLTDRQLLDAISIGQFTPGPVFTTATFIGYLVGGFPGALLATLGIFLPSFAFIAIIHPLASRLRSYAWTSALLEGINSAALALMGGVLLQLGRGALLDPLTWILALIALIVLLRFKINSIWLILAGAIVGIIYFQFR
ncbi:MAG: chromate efflux transporter [Ktedonobacteraceae bacterium]|nr:chromate efflux transporter [Ktedonobacteraceae bacterium]